MYIERLIRRAALMGLTLVGAAACSDSTGVAAPQSVSLSFAVTAPAPATTAAAASTPSGALSRIAGPPMVITGTNGTLSIAEVRIIINQVELEAADGSCDATSGSESDCSEFEAPPRLLDLPLDGQPIAAVTELIDPGTYKALDFEIEDLEDDKSDPVEAAAIAAARSQIRSEIGDWPEEASALVVGSFTPTGGAAVDFRVFLKAEIEIEMDLVPNLVVDGDGVASRDLTVDVSPQLWFTRPDGSLVELDAYDYDSTQQLLEFEVEMEDGFTEVEVGD